MFLKSLIIFCWSLPFKALSNIGCKTSWLPTVTAPVWLAMSLFIIIWLPTTNPSAPLTSSPNSDIASSLLKVLTFLPSLAPTFSANSVDFCNFCDLAKSIISLFCFLRLSFSILANSIADSGPLIFLFLFILSILEAYCFNWSLSNDFKFKEFCF